MTSEFYLMIDCIINNNNLSFYCSCVYGHPSQSSRHLLWSKHSATTRHDPWLVIGDFNEITGNNEKLGGPLRNYSYFHRFKDMITQCDMKDLKHKGNIFSWSGQRITTHTGRRIRETIQSYLDKAMANSSWSALFLASENLFLKPIASDHQPVILTIEVKTSIRRGQF